MNVCSQELPITRTMFFIRSPPPVKATSRDMRDEAQLHQNNLLLLPRQNIPSSYSQYLISS